jgi:hypothetical protein
VARRQAGSRLNPLRVRDKPVPFDGTRYLTELLAHTTVHKVEDQVYSGLLRHTGLSGTIRFYQKGAERLNRIMVGVPLAGTLGGDTASPFLSVRAYGDAPRGYPAACRRRSNDG